MASDRPDGWYWVRRGECDWQIARRSTEGRSHFWITSGDDNRYSNRCFSEIGPQVTRDDNPPIHMNASDVEDALAAMIAAKRALEAAYARPVLIVDLMRVIERLEAYQT